MKTMIAVSIVAVLAMTSGAQAGGFMSKRTNLLSNITGVVASTGIGVGDVNILNGNAVAVGNNSNILSGIANGVLSGNKTGNGNSLLNGVLNGNGILGIGGQNRTHHGW